MHAILMLMASGLAIWYSRPEVIVFVSWISIGYLLWYYKDSAINWPNAITLSRLLLISVGMCMVLSLSIGHLFLIMCAAVLLDVLDGYIARKVNKETDLGFYLDMEVDALFVLLMSFYFYEYRQVPWLVLVPGVLRYLYKLMTIVIPRPDFEESKKPYASIIAGIYFIILLARMRLPGYWVDLVFLLGGLSICFSFGVSFIEYLSYAKKNHSAE